MKMLKTLLELIVLVLIVFFISLAFYAYLE